MIAELIKDLYKAGLTPSAEEVADILWLAAQIVRGQKFEGQSATISTTIDQRSGIEADLPSAIVVPFGSEETSPSETPDETNTSAQAENLSSKADSLPLTASASPLYAASAEISGLPFRSPGAAALPRKLAMGRALRPLKRNISSRSRTILDEQATVQYSADSEYIIPVEKFAPVPWLDVVLVVDEWPSMVIWQQAIKELQSLLIQQGMFRNILTWGFFTDLKSGEIYLHEGTGPGTHRNRPRSPKELIDPQNQRLILVISDCISPAWFDGKVMDMLKIWTGQKGMTAIVQVLPTRLWQRTALRQGVEVKLRASAPGMPNTKLEIQWPRSWRTRTLPPTKVKLPIVTLQPRSLNIWAKLIAGIGGEWLQGRIFFFASLQDANRNEGAAKQSSPAQMQVPPEARLEQFWATASPLARKLAAYLATAPLSLPVMRLVQHVMLPESSQIHLAEFFLSGLLKHLTKYNPDTHPDQYRYDFISTEVRNRLLKNVDIVDKFKVLTQISQFVDNRTGQTLSFQSIVADPTLLNHLRLDEESLPFAYVSSQVLRSLGGAYKDLAERLEAAASSSSTSLNGLSQADLSDKYEPPKYEPARTQGTNFYALLIGIDFYLPNQLPGGYFYGHLGGCVRDVVRVRDFLTSRLGVPPDHIISLTATNNGGDRPQEPATQWPTYDNIITGFRQITIYASPGDEVLIHYSGHGGSAITVYPELKGANEYDEALVPTDIGNGEDRYVRDLYLAQLLQEMVEKKLNITLVLDSCHSSGTTRGLGATRGGRATPRGIGVIDTSKRTPLMNEKERQAQIANWQTALRNSIKNLRPASGWLPEPQGYTLLAACRGTELAYEDTFIIDGVPTRSGALTYALLEALSNLSAGLTYKMLHDRVVAKVHAYFDLQTPMLHGDGTRTVFGIEQTRSTYRVNVRQVDAANRRVQLDAGQSSLVRKGAQFAIYPPATLGVARSARRLAIVTVTDVGAVDAWAEITEELVKEPIEQGAQALLFNPGSTRLQRTVGMVTLDDLPKSIDQQRALQAVVNALKTSDSSFVWLVEDGATADFLISVNEEGNYVISDKANQPLPNLRPALSITDPDAAKTVVVRLIHLTQYRNVRELANYDDSSPLSNKLQVEVCRLPPDYQRGDKPDLTPFDLTAGPPTVKVGQYFAVRIKNLLPELPPTGADPVRNELNITVLDLQPDWGISQIYPPDGAAFLPLDAQREVVRIFKADLPQGYQQGTDVVKAFATIGTTSFRWLELPALDQPRSVIRSALTMPRNALETLLAAINERGGASFRNASSVSDPSTEWVSEQVEITVVA